MRVPTNSLTPPARTLRPVDPDGIDMTLLGDSLDKHGLLVPLTVSTDDVIVDGYRRWLIFRARGWAEIDVHRVEGDPDDLRVIAQTRHTEFGRSDKRGLVGSLLVQDPTLTAAEIAHRLQWSPAEVESLAGVEYLIPAFARQYASRRIDLAEVWYLSRIQDGGQLTLLESSDDPLIDRAAALHREVRSARRRSVSTRPRGKGLNAISRELDDPAEAGVELIKAGARTPLDGWTAALKWILGKDQNST